MTAPTFATSYSSANTLSDCGEQYRLAKIERVPKLQAVYLIGGRAFHTATEWVDLSWGWPEPPTWDFFTEARDTFRQALWDEVDQARQSDPDTANWLTAGVRPVQNLDWWAQAGPLMVGRYIGWRASRPNLMLAEHDGQPAIEVGFEVPIAGQIRVGSIDRVFVDQDTGVEIEIDLKTGSKVPDKHLQHAIYREAWYQLTGRTLYWGAYYMARKGQLSDLIDLTPHTTERLEGVLAMADRAIQTGSFVPKPTQGFPCSNCLVRPYCRYV